MILPCPACQARFMVPDERITPKGIKIRCPKCRFVFIMKAQRRSVSVPEASGQAAAAGTIGDARPAKKKKPARERLPEAQAASLSTDELATLAEEEIVDMDELAQATEQSGTAFAPNIKAEHFEPVASVGPSVMVDDSLMDAAALHSATFVGKVRIPDDLPRISPASTVSDTWIDLPDRKIPTLPPMPAQGPQPVAASGSMGTASGSMGTASGSMGAASGSMGAASGSMGAAAGALGDAEQLFQTPAAAEPDTWPAVDDVALGDVDLVEESEPEQAPGAHEQHQEAAASVLGGVLGPAVPSTLPQPAPGPGAAVDAPDSTPAPSPSQHFQMAYTLSAATSFTADELAEFDEYEGLLVEERRALRKGHGATIILIVGIVLGAGVLGVLGYLGWQVLNPPKKKPPSWGHLQLSGQDHTLVERKGKPALVKVSVTVKNSSPKARFRNVHVQASLLSATKEVKCQFSAPCGPQLSGEELLDLDSEGYPDLLRVKSKTTAYNVQLNPGQQENCQVLLFCGDRYQESDRVRIAVDEEQSERVAD